MTDAKVRDRVTIRLGGDLGDAIAEVQSLTHAASATEVVRRALLVYHTLVMQKAQGNEPVILNTAGDGPDKIPLFL